MLVWATNVNFATKDFSSPRLKKTIGKDTQVNLRTGVPIAPIITLQTELCSSIQNKLYKCSKCLKQCDLLYNLAQHIRGYHGDGWLLPCGEREQWPSLVQKHKRKCKNCALIKVKKEQKELRKWSKLDIRKIRITFQLVHKKLQFKLQV